MGHSLYWWTWETHPSGVRRTLRGYQAVHHVSPSRVPETSTQGILHSQASLAQVFSVAIDLHVGDDIWNSPCNPGC
jgi:hypothetical protein